MSRVLLLNRDFHYHGGVSNVLLTLARENHRQKRVELYCASLQEPSEAMRSAFGQLKIDLHCIGDHRYFKPAMALRKILRSEKIDVVVACSFKAILVAKIATIGLRCQIVHYIHAVDLVIEGNAKKKLFAWLSKNDPMLFVSRTVERAHRPEGHRGPGAVIYNGVQDPLSDPNSQPYPKSFRRELGVPEDALLFCYVGAFIPWKDHATTLRAFEMLDSQLNAHLMLIGKDEPGSTVQQQVAAMNNPRIHIIAPRPDARRILGTVDIYVHSSRREGFGLAVVEAMLAGRPIVATREGAFLEYIEDGQTGLLANAGDPQSFADKMEMLASDKNLAARIAAAGREECLKRFSPAKCANEVFDFLDVIVAKPNM
ncbi:MAG TPA: glycosyltransferase family 4 protein [Tepidisphaeraceae bacterium]|nr:glycosyltransferase family 4 protein [Tepidisphaeraceae bacterium]